MNQKEAIPTAKIDISGHQLARNTALNLVGRIAPLLVAVASMPYVIHRLGPDRFGLLSLAWIVVGYFALFDLGIGPATTKFVAELLGRGEVEKLPELVWTALVSQTCFGLVAGILLALGSPLLVNRVLKIPADLHPQAHLMFLILAVALPMDFASGSLRGVLAASQRFDLLNALGIPASALNYLLPVAALALGFGLPAIVLFLVLARIASLTVLCILCTRLYPSLRARVGFDRRLVRSLLGFGGWVTVSAALAPILVYTDRFVIGATISVAAVGYYSVAYDTLTRLHFIPAALAGPLMPAFSSLQGAGDTKKLAAYFIRAHKYLFLILAPVLLAAIAFARNIFDLWIGGEFAAKATLPFQIIAVGMLVGLLAPVSGALTQGGGRPSILFWLYLVEVPLNTLLTWFLTVHWNIVGASLSYTIRTIIETVILFLITIRVFEVEIDLPRSLKSLGTLGAVAFSIVLIPVFWIAASAPIEQKVLLFAGAMAVYTFLTYRFALDHAERGLLWGFIGRRWLGISG